VGTFRFASRQYGVYFIHKDDSRLHAASHCKQGTDHLLALPYPFAGQGRCADVEEGGLDVAGNGLANQGFACAWRAEQKQPFCRSPGALKWDTSQVKPELAIWALLTMLVMWTTRLMLEVAQDTVSHPAEMLW